MDLIFETASSLGSSVRLITGSDSTEGGGLMNPTVPTVMRGVERSEICLERFVTLFTGAYVFPCLTVGEGAIVSAGGVVTKDLRP